MTVNKEIPDFLIEMSKRINTQDNRMTADPVFEVRYKQYLVTEHGYNEHHCEIFPSKWEERPDTLYRSDKDDDYSKIAEWLHGNDEKWCAEFCADYDESFDQMSLEDFKEFVNDNFDRHGCDLPESLTLLHFQEIEVTLNTHLTEADAKAFIERKQHDYPPLYVYVNSLAYCWNMIELRNWIKGLTDGK